VSLSSTGWVGFAALAVMLPAVVAVGLYFALRGGKDECGD
jgi:hypothetical protein